MKNIALVHGELIDGLGGDPLQDSLVLIEGKRLAYVGPLSLIHI